MRDAQGGGLGFAVVTQQLAQAAREVRLVTDVARAGALEGLPLGLDLGHDGLTRALVDLCGRWDRGLSLLVGDSAAMADALDETAADYARDEARAQQAYGAAARVGAPAG